jgi:hypothetical protein
MIEEGQAFAAWVERWVELEKPFRILLILGEGKIEKYCCRSSDILLKRVFVASWGIEDDVVPPCEWSFLVMYRGLRRRLYVLDAFACQSENYKYDPIHHLLTRQICVYHAISNSQSCIWYLNPSQSSLPCLARPCFFLYCFMIGPYFMSIESSKSWILRPTTSISQSWVLQLTPLSISISISVRLMHLSL